MDGVEDLDILGGPEQEGNDGTLPCDEIELTTFQKEAKPGRQKKRKTRPVDNAVPQLPKKKHAIRQDRIQQEGQVEKLDQKQKLKRGQKSRALRHEKKVQKNSDAPQKANGLSSSQPARPG